MTGRPNQDLPDNLQTAFEKAANFESCIITKQSINNRKIHEVHNIDVTQCKDEIEVIEAHIRNPNYKGKNYDPNYQQNRTKPNISNSPSHSTTNHHSSGSQGPSYNKSNQHDKPVNISVTLHGPISKEQLYKIQVLRHLSQYRDRIKPEDRPATGEYAKSFSKFCPRRLRSRKQPQRKLYNLVNT